jgi:hypothetical protein
MQWYRPFFDWFSPNLLSMSAAVTAPGSRCFGNWELITGSDSTAIVSTVDCFKFRKINSVLRICLYRSDFLALRFSGIP